jgi:ribose transport system ATP-binding protein
MGEPVSFRSPRAALHSGVALVPQDRRTEGLMMGLSIRENLTLGILDRFARLGWISLGKEQAAARDIADRFSIRATTVEQEVGTLSGGNQQKVLVGKMLEAGVEVLLLADVTRGIDVGTRADMYSLIRGLAANGIAVVMYSSDSSELASLCHRVAVMYDWTITDTLEGDDLTEPNLLRAAVGLGVEAVPNG